MKSEELTKSGVNAYPNSRFRFRVDAAGGEIDFVYTQMAASMEPAGTNIIRFAKIAAGRPAPTR